MKKVRMTAMAMAAAMIMSLCPVYAAAPSGASTETKTVRVTNVDGATAVNAYRIVEPIFSGSPVKFGGYQRAAGITSDMLGDITSPTSPEITNFAKAIKSNSHSLTIPEAWIYNGTEYTTQAAAQEAANSTVVQKWCYGDTAYESQAEAEQAATDAGGSAGDASQKWTYNGTVYASQGDAYNAAITHRNAATLDTSTLTTQAMTFTGGDSWIYNGVSYGSKEDAQNAAVSKKYFYDGGSPDGYNTAEEAKTAAGNPDVTLTNKWYYDGQEYATEEAALAAADSAISNSKGTAEAALPAGVWIVLVTDTANAEYVYNPMVVSVQYDDASELGTNNANMSANGVDATGRYNIGSEGLYAKRSTIPFDLSITTPDSQYADDHETPDTPVLAGSDDLQAGDTGHYQILTQIPEYSDAYTDKVSYSILTELPTGFDNPTDMKIYVKNDGGEFVELTNIEKATVAPVENTNDFQVTFTSAGALENAGKEIKVTFDSKLNNNANTGRTANDITSTLTFTNDLDGHTTQKNDSVHEYSFSLDSELLKVEKDVNNGELKPLTGATFTITRTSPDPLDASHVAPNPTTYITTADGHVKFDRLDEGTYTIQETAAPNGYAVNNTVYTVTITPTYTLTGSASRLDKYKVRIDYKDANNNDQYAEYEFDGNVTDAGQAGKEPKITVDNATNVVDENNTSSVKVVNIKMAELPHTGRNGTILFSIIGSAIMAAAVIIILKKRNELVD